MKLRLGVTTSSSVEKALWIAATAERTGVKGLMVGEDLGSRQDVFTLTSLLLMRTRRIEVGIGVTSPLYHNLTTIGRASATLHEIAPSRFTLGIGVGGLHDLAGAGIPVEKPRMALRDAVTLLRPLWSGETLHHSSKHFHLNSYVFHRARGKMPLYLGVRGPRLLRLAGELADGAIISGSRSYLKEAVEILSKSLKSHHRGRGEFTIIAWTPTLVAGGGELDAAKRVVATIIADTPEEALTKLPIEGEALKRVKRLVAAGERREALSLIDDSMMEEFCVHGEAGEVVEKLKSLERIGVDEAVFGPPYGTPYRAAIEEVGEAWRRE